MVVVDSADVFLQYFYLFLGMGAVGFFAFHLVLSLFPDPALLAAQQRLGVESATRQYRSSLLKLLAPFYRLFVPRIQQIKMPLYRQNKKAAFIAAGVADQFDPDEFVGLKIVAGLLVAAFVALVALNLGKVPSLEALLLAALAGFFIPDLAILDLRKRRQKAILRELPTVMDLLTLSVEAGLDFIAAISRVIEFSKPGALKDEFNQMLKELQLGTVRADALKNMAERVQLPEISSFATVLIQVDQMGGSVGPVLRAQSDLIRNARFQRAEREGAKAAQKLLLPLIVFILPSIFIVLFGPTLCDVVYNQTWFFNLFGNR